MYEILGVPKDANLELIKSVYKSLGHIYHPDKYQGDSKYAEEKMKDINLAYSVLSNDVKRKEYDNRHNIKTEPFVSRREKESFKNEYKNNFNKSKFKETFKNIVFGHELTEEQKKLQKAADAAYWKRIFITVGIMCFISATVWLLGNYHKIIGNNHWLAERFSDRILPGSIVGFLLGLGLSNPDDYKKNKLKVFKIVFITTISVITVALFIPKNDGKNANINSNCKWTNVPGRYSEPDC